MGAQRFPSLWAFWPFGGSDGDLVLEPDDRFKGSRNPEVMQAAW